MTYKGHLPGKPFRCIGLHPFSEGLVTALFQLIQPLPLFRIGPMFLTRRSFLRIKAPPREKDTATSCVRSGKIRITLAWNRIVVTAPSGFEKWTSNEIRSLTARQVSNSNRAPWSLISRSHPRPITLFLPRPGVSAVTGHLIAYRTSRRLSPCLPSFVKASRSDVDTQSLNNEQRSL